MKQKIIIALVTILGTFTCTGAFAASQGSIGSTSTGTTDISLTIDPLVRITGMSDIGLGTFNGTDDISGTDDVCVYSNTSGNYMITASDGDADGFKLVNGGASIVYEVKWNDQDADTTALVDGTQFATAQNNASTTTSDCGGGTNATIKIAVTAANMLLVVPNVYTATLTILVEPE